jgi:hypothetical protein
MNMLPLILAQAQPDTMISGEWLTTTLKVIIAGLALILGKYWGQRVAANASRDVTLKDPVPEIAAKRVYSPPTFSQHQELVRRVASLENETKEHREYVEAQLRDIRREQAEQFVKLMNAGETRKDAIMESMNDMVRNFHSRVDQLIDGHRQAPRKS